jgi:hypothetical protein
VDQTWTSAEAARWTSDRLRELAEIYLRTVALGVAAEDLALTLARAVLDDDLGRLALAVLEDAEHHYARATELAKHVLDGLSYPAACQSSALMESTGRLTLALRCDKV